MALLRTLAEQYPDNRDWILPTSFGNTLRSFEIYSRVMYGIDSIPTWSRLQAVIPVEFAAHIDSAKARLDFWLNLLVTGFILLISYFVLAFLDKLQFSWLFLILNISLTTISYYRMVSAAFSWGDYVKADYDVFLPDLHKKLCFISPTNAGQEFDQWQNFSRAILYRDRESIPLREFTDSSKKVS